VSEVRGFDFEKKVSCTKLPKSGNDCDNCRWYEEKLSREDEIN
jgi:hypothetical protein